MNHRHDRANPRQDQPITWVSGEGGDDLEGVVPEAEVLDPAAVEEPLVVQDPAEKLAPFEIGILASPVLALALSNTVHFGGAFWFFLGALILSVTFALKRLVGDARNDRAVRVGLQAPTTTLLMVLGWSATAFVLAGLRMLFPSPLLAMATSVLAIGGTTTLVYVASARLFRKGGLDTSRFMIYFQTAFLLGLLPMGYAHSWIAFAWTAATTWIWSAAACAYLGGAPAGKLGRMMRAWTSLGFLGYGATLMLGICPISTPLAVALLGAILVPQLVADRLCEMDEKTRQSSLPQAGSRLLLAPKDRE